MANEKTCNVVFVGGYDAEMVAIINVCRETGVEVVDKKLGWGAAASAYAEEIKKVVSEGKIPVLVELVADIQIPDEAIIIDHHNDNAGKPASILQVLNMLGIEPNREQCLIAANDSGYIPAMLALGATADEIAQIRYADRAAQGITPEQEVEAERAIAAAEIINGVTVIRMDHSKTATVCDRLFSSDKEQRLLILSNDGESNFFGNGELCKLLQGEKVGKTPEGWDAYSHFGGWIGGNLPTSGFWGGYANQEEVLAYVVNYFAK